MKEIEIFRKHQLYEGRMISGSKSGYRMRFPDNDVVFNACIFTPTHRSIWHGDLDITIDAEALQNVCNELGEEMVITYESVGWYGEEKGRKFKDIEKHGHAKFTPNSKKYLSRIYGSDFEGLKAGGMTVITTKGVDWIEKEILKIE